MIVVRYAGDDVGGFQHRSDAQCFLEDLKGVLGKFQLDLHPDKTRLIEFGRFARANRASRGRGKPGTFDFLGMTHYCDQTRKGRFRVGRKPAGKRVRRTLRRIKEAIRRRWHEDKDNTARWLGRVVSGWLNYYAVPGSFRFLSAFVQQVKRLLLRGLRRRSQKDRTSWAEIDRLTRRHWPKPQIRHPWPSQRLPVTT